MKIRMQTAFLVFAVLATTSCSKESVAPVQQLKAENVQAIEGDLLELVNEYRVSQGLQSLVFSEVAYSYANEHTEYMISSGSISHDNFDSRASKIAEAVDAKAVGENVAKKYASARAVFQGWIASEGHRITMEGTFTHTAVSVMRAPGGELYFTQLFYLQ